MDSNLLAVVLVRAFGILTFPVEAVLDNAMDTSLGVRVALLAPRMMAAAPATCGLAIEVPLKLTDPPVRFEDTIALPGANRSRHCPWLL